MYLLVLILALLEFAIWFSSLRSFSLNEFNEQMCEGESNYNNENSKRCTLLKRDDLVLSILISVMLLLGILVTKNQIGLYFV